MRSIENYTKEEGTIAITNGSRPPVIELKGGQVNVKTLKLSISRKHRWMLLIDLLTIFWVGIVSTLLFCIDNLTPIKLMVISFFGLLMLFASVGKTIFDLVNWVYTMQKFNERMGEWYCEDVANICNDLITAGVKVAAEEMDKSKKGEREEVNGECAQEKSSD